MVLPFPAVVRGLARREIGLRRRLKKDASRRERAVEFTSMGMGSLSIPLRVRPQDPGRKKIKDSREGFPVLSVRYEYLKRSANGVIIGKVGEVYLRFGISELAGSRSRQPLTAGGVHSIRETVCENARLEQGWVWAIPSLRSAAADSRKDGAPMVEPAGENMGGTRRQASVLQIHLAQQRPVA